MHNYERMLLKKILFLSLLLIVLPPVSWAIKDDLAVKCILGEARGESFQGQVAVAEVLRRRGSVRGFVGCSAAGNPTASQWLTALKAWRRSRWTDYARGATNFDNEKAFGKPWWAYGMKKVAVIGKHCFWKEN